MEVLKAILFFILRTLIRALSFFIYPRKIIHKERLPKKSKYIAVSNHLHWVDAVYVFLKGPGRRYLLAKKELAEISPFLKSMEKAAGIVFVDRDNPSVASIKAILGYLKRDKPILVFPEGTRNRESRELLETKSGAAVFAVKSSAPVIPMLIYERARAFRRNYLYVGEPFELSEFYGKKLTEELLNEANALVRAHMLLEMEKMDDYVMNKRWKKKNRIITADGSA